MDDITMEYETVARFHLPTQNLVLRAPSCVNVSLSLSLSVCVCVCVCVSGSGGSPVPSYLLRAAYMQRSEKQRGEGGEKQRETERDTERQSETERQRRCMLAGAVRRRIHEVVRFEVLSPEMRASNVLHRAGERDAIQRQPHGTYLTPLHSPVRHILMLFGKKAISRAHDRWTKRN